MPPCLPIKVNVSCGRLNGSYRNSVSKVSPASGNTLMKGMISEPIDISNLSSGYYVLNIENLSTQESKALKFYKK